jgi:Cu(I)/Ag(I) efflux system membrane protein CusA/SilA
LFAPLAWTKTWAMAAAAGLAVTLVPVLMVLFIRGRVRPASENPLNRLLIAAYRPVIDAALRSPRFAVAVCGLVLLIGIWPAPRLGTEFMPPLEEGDLLYMPTTHPGISIDKARELLQQTDRLIMTVPEVERVHGKIGRADTATDPAPLTMIETVIRLKPRDQWRTGMTPDGLRAELDRIVQVPGLTNAWIMPIKARLDMLATGIKTPVGIKVAGPDLAVIEEIGTRIEQVLAEVPGTASVFAERVTGGRYLVVDIDRARASRFGLNIREVQDVVRSAIGGVNVTRTVEGRERYPVNLRYPQSERDSLQRLRLLPIVTPSGARIALADVASVQVEDGPPVIRSENARPNGWIYVDIDGRDLGSYVAKAQDVVREQVDLPAGYALAWSGQYEYLERARSRLALIIPLTLAVIVLLLYLSFRSVPEVVIILGTLPLAGAGGLWLLYLLDYELSIAVGVGFIALAGVAVEIGVVMLVYLNQSVARREAETGPERNALTADELVEAVREGALLRVRPVIMTVTATIVGLLPIMFGTGTGSEVMRRIAAPMVGGLVSATLLALVLVPSLYLLWRRMTPGERRTT